MTLKMQVSNYVVLNKKINKKILLLSDIHYYSKQDINKLDNIFKYVTKINPSYICIAGDLFEESFIKDSEYFINWLTKLGKFYKVIIVLGNHDICMKTIKNRTVNFDLISKIKNIKNIYLLDNQNIIIDDINFIGISLPYSYYYHFRESSDYLVKYLNNKKYYVDKKYFNIMLCHSPIAVLNSYDKIDLLKKIDLSLYGHTHGGMMPTIFRKITKNRGLLGPTSKGIILFPKYSHGYIKNKNAIISTGVTKLSEKNPFCKLNFLFKGEITVIDIIKK